MSARGEWRAAEKRRIAAKRHVERKTGRPFTPRFGTKCNKRGPTLSTEQQQHKVFGLKE